MSAVEAAASDVEAPVEFTSQEEEDAYFSKINKAREKDATTRVKSLLNRQTTTLQIFTLTFLCFSS